MQRESYPNIRRCLESATRTTRWGPEPDPVAHDILETPDVAALEQALLALGIRNVSFLAGGLSSIVLEAGKRVVRLGIGPAKARPSISEVLQAHTTGLIGRIGYEILPKADVSKVTPQQVSEMAAALARRGYRFSDPGTDNLGHVEGRLVVLDSGAVTSVR
jgi:hypothetical protein